MSVEVTAELTEKCARALLAAPFAILFLYANAVIFIYNEFRRKSSSYVPPVGGFLGAVCVWNYPFADLRPWAWIPVLLDGCVLSIVSLLVRVLLRRMHRVIDRKMDDPKCQNRDAATRTGEGGA